MERSDQIGQLAAALAAAQGSLEDAAKDSTNPHFRSKYADLASIREAVRDPLSKNGLAYTQLLGFEDGKATCTTVLMHKSGEYIGSTLAIPVAQANAQTIGSAQTYARRYSLMAIVGIAPSEDDDGNGAVQSSPDRAPLRQADPPKRRDPEPAVSSAAIAMGREVDRCTSLDDLAFLKRTNEFGSFWQAANAVDRKHVNDIAEAAKAKWAAADHLVA